MVGSPRGQAARAAGAPAAPPPAGEPAAALAQVGEAQDRVDQVVVGGQLERVDAGAARSAVAQLCLALLGGRGEALAKAAVVRVDEHLLAGLGILHRQQAEVGQLQLQRIVAAARRPPRGAARAAPSALLPAGLR